MCVSVCVRNGEKNHDHRCDGNELFESSFMDTICVHSFHLYPLLNISTLLLIIVQE